MPWVVGIDEAGYGPNLGPLVQAVAGLYLPGDDLKGWESTKAIFRKAHERPDVRLVVDDSKEVYTRFGIDGLARTVLAFTVAAGINGHSTTFNNLLSCVSACDPSVSSEYWFDGNASMLDDVRRSEVMTSLNSWLKWFVEYGSSPLYHVRIVNPSSFNRVADQTGTKATVVTNGIIELLKLVRLGWENPNVPFREEPFYITCDKLGGRNFYGPILQEAFPDGWPVAEVEGAAESRYRILNLGRDVTVSFKPRADGENVCVALASMLAKYVREVCMKQFNDFWAKHVPGIKPTAGYPVDAKRFYAEIRPAMARLGIPEDTVWRKK